MDEIRRAFESMDADKTGAITALQLKNAIESLGDHADISEAEAMIQEAASTYTDRSKY
jgi:Ca2+-binding EF-hand superfamily protein